MILKNKQSVAKCQWRRFRSYCFCLTLDGIRGHKGQKGQILKNVANGLKHMQN